jgi:DNA gyrase subunit B
LRGKILNVERSRFDRIIGSQEIRNVITALGTGIGPAGGTGIKMDSLRYHKVVIMTDADVDGAHIRTLLLTFFFRQMPELIERGHLFIAQPPLYGVKSGNKELYIKDEAGLRDFIMGRYLEDRSVCGEGQDKAIGGRALRDYLLGLIGERDFRERQSRRGFPPRLWPAILAAFHKSQEGFLSLEWTKGLAAALAKAGLDALGPEDLPPSPLPVPADEAEKAEEEIEEIRPKGYALALAALHDKRKRLTLNQDFLEGELFQKYLKMKRKTSDLMTAPFTVRHKERRYEIFSEAELLDDMEAAGQRGLKVQRYKGLGEMNPPQLWETTMDPAKRTFLKVRVEDAMDADDIFTVLMGDQVEPRRDFIQENALNVRELDI